MPSANCFDAPTLKDYLLGRLSEEQSDVVAAHLEACLSCEATVSQLDRASDTLTNGLRLPAIAAEPQTDDELQKALNKVQSLEALANHQTSEVSKTSEVSVDRSPVLRDYRLLEPLGSGGMGQVFKAVHTRLDRLVAVKLLPARRLGDDQAVARFQREMRVIGQLSHPAIVQATDAGEVDGTHFLVMEYVEGCDLNTLAKVCGPLSVADACEITRQAAVGLEYAHQQGIVHRDIKPSNLMLSVEQAARLLPPAKQTSANDLGQASRPSYVKILDLGLALLSGVQAPVDELTTVGQLMGTLDYMAPEQLEDSHLVGPRADIYALAATLYRLLTGFAPFANENRKTPLQKLRALATQAAPPIRERRADLPLDLAAIIDRALSRDPVERFVSMSEFAAALAPWCAGHDLTQLVGHVSNVPGPSIESPSARPESSARRGSPDPAAWLDRRSPSASRRTVETELHSGDLRSAPAAGSGDPRRALDGHVENVSHGSPPRRTLLIALALLFLAALGIVITIETNTGTLIVESLRDGVEVRVKKSGKMVEQLELTTGPKSAKLAAGEYEIEILGDADGLQIQNGKFVLKRGDTVVAKVTEVPKGQPVARKSEPKEPEQPATPVVEAQPRQPIDILDRNAKGMNTFFESNPELIGAKKVRDALQKKVSVDFNAIPLTDCVSFLKEQVEIELFVDDLALTEEGIALDSPCTLCWKDVRIATALEFLLRPLNCAWTIDQGQVRITTLAKEKEQMVTRWYPAGRLLPGVRQAVERLNAEGPDLRNGGDGGFGGGTGGGGFFRVDDHAERFWLQDRARRGSPDPAASIDRRSPFSSIDGDAQHELRLGDLRSGPAAGSGDLRRAQSSPKKMELWLFGGGFNFTVEAHFSQLFLQALSHPWQARDGEGGNFEFLQNVLVVRHTWRAHADIEALLRLIESAFFQPLTEPTEIRPAGYLADADVVTRKKLKQTVDADFQETPLSDVAEWIRERLDVQVLLDQVAMNEEAIAADVPVTLHFKGISGELLLSRVLKPLQLDHQIEEGLLIVTTAAKVKERLVTKVYDIRDLLDRGLHPKGPVRAIESATSGPWINTDGEGGSMLLFADTLLIIRQTPAVHDEITNFLAGLRTQLGDQPKVPRVIKPRPKTPLAAQPNQPSLNEPKPTTPAPAKPTADNQPRYDGKSFDEWLAILDTERSPARLADAIEALGLLGRDTHAQQVAERVLKILRVVDLDSGFGFGGNNRPSIYSEVFKLFNNLPAAIVQRACANELKNGTPRSRKFLVNNADLMRIELPVADELLSTMLEVCRDKDPAIRAVAVANLQWFAGDASNSRFAAQRIASLHAALTDQVAEVAMSAAEQLRDVEAESKFVAETFARIVAKPGSNDQRLSALNQLAVMGPQAASVAPQVAAVLLEPLSDDDLHIDQRFDGWLGPFRSEKRNTFHFVAAVALARMGKAAAAELPTIQKALDNPAAMNGYEDRKNVSVTDRIQWPDLLRTVRTRIELPPAFDLRGGDLNVIETVLRFENWRYQLLQMEHALLLHYRAKNHPSVQELANRTDLLGFGISVHPLHELQQLHRPAPRNANVKKIAESLTARLKQPVWGMDRPSELPTGLIILANSLRETAIIELGKLGAAARDALPALKMELEFKDKSVAAAAEKAIKQIEAAKDDTKTN